MVNNVHFTSKTIGLKFWKTPSRKIYTVDKAQVRGKGSPKDSRSQEELPKLSEQLTRQLQQMKEEMQELKNDTEEIKLGMWEKSDGIPKAFKEALEHAFKCKICQGVPMKPPIILAKCCSSILGCQTCVDTWFSGPAALSKQCPLCKHERGYAQTITLRGLDEAAAEVGKLFTTAERHAKAVDRSSARGSN